VAAEASGIDFDALARASAFPGDPSAAAGVESVQTHISQVFLTGARVYKFRKAVDLGFVRFATRRERNEDCLRELALNRRMAPDVYLGLAALRGAGASAQVGPLTEALECEAGGIALEHCVVMRRLPTGRDALSLLQRGHLEASQLDRLAECVAVFHGAHGLGIPAPFAAEAWLERCTAPVEDNFRLLGDSPEALVPPALLRSAHDRSSRFAREQAARFEQRRCDGRAVDGHGDLHLQHVWFERDDDPPLAIDCLEFNERLRRIDQAAEVAFTAMDLAYRGRRDLAERFLSVYARERDDFDLYSVVDYFASYRAAVRAKVAALSAADSGIDPEQRERAAGSARRHLELADELLRSRPAAPLVLVAGAVGTGKSSVAAALAERAGGVVVASDRVRKHLAGLDPTQRPTPQQAERMYAPEARHRVYGALLERARPVLASGRMVLLDATWSRRGLRQEAAALAKGLDAPRHLIEVRCAPSVARERLAQRQARDRDPSDAGPELHAASAAGFEGPEADEGWTRWRVRTDEPGWRDSLDAPVRALGGGAGPAVPG
jgi:aminoglycoside phosphotransferase family enzyme/predicted kinase